VSVPAPVLVPVPASFSCSHSCSRYCSRYCTRYIPVPVPVRSRTCTRSCSRSFKFLYVPVTVLAPVRVRASGPVTIPISYSNAIRIPCHL
jgi:hypothetical protein